MSKNNLSTFSGHLLIGKNNSLDVLLLDKIVVMSGINTRLMASL